MPSPYEGNKSSQNFIIPVKYFLIKVLTFIVQHISIWISFESITLNFLLRQQNELKSIKYIF